MCYLLCNAQKKLKWEKMGDEKSVWFRIKITPFGLLYYRTLYTPTFLYVIIQNDDKVFESAFAAHETDKKPRSLSLSLSPFYPTICSPMINFSHQNETQTNTTRAKRKTNKETIIKISSYREHTNAGESVIHTDGKKYGIFRIIQKHSYRLIYAIHSIMNCRTSNWRYELRSNCKWD